MNTERFDQMIAYLESEAQVVITPTDSNPPKDWQGETLLCATYRLLSIPAVSYMVCTAGTLCVVSSQHAS